MDGISKALIKKYMKEISNDLLDTQMQSTHNTATYGLKKSQF